MYTNHPSIVYLRSGRTVASERTFCSREEQRFEHRTHKSPQTEVKWVSEWKTCREGSIMIANWWTPYGEGRKVNVLGAFVRVRRGWERAARRWSQSMENNAGVYLWRAKQGCCLVTQQLISRKTHIPTVLPGDLAGANPMCGCGGGWITKAVFLGRAFFCEACWVCLLAAPAIRKNEPSRLKNSVTDREVWWKISNRELVC